MAKHGKKFTAAAAQVEDRTVFARGGDSPDPEGEVRQVRRDGRDGDAAGRRSEARGPDGARHGRPAPRPRQEQESARDCRRRQAEGSAGRRRGLRRRRRDGGEDPRRLDGLRRGRRDARHDARRRPPRQGARPARPDAEPEDRHRDSRTSPRRSRRSRPARWSSAWTRPGSCTRRSARPRFPTQNLVENAHALVDSVVKAKPSAAKGKYLKSVTVSSTMGPGVAVDTAHIDERQTERLDSSRATEQMAVTRAEKEQELQDLNAAFKAADSADPGGLPRPERPEGHGAASSAPRREGAVQGREEHARQACEQGHGVRVARSAVRGHDRHRLHR